MAEPSPTARHGVLAAGLRRLPRSLAHPVVLISGMAAYFSGRRWDTGG